MKSNSVDKSDSKQVKAVGIVLSKFSFNDNLNPKFVEGDFTIDMKSIKMYKDKRPSFVLISSAGTERINKLTTPEQIKNDIPIVQLNPQVRKLVLVLYLGSFLTV